jgi:hypothetical protein
MKNVEDRVVLGGQMGGEGEGPPGCRREVRGEYNAIEVEHGICGGGSGGVWEWAIQPKLAQVLRFKPFVLRREKRDLPNSHMAHTHSRIPAYRTRGKESLSVR